MKTHTLPLAATKYISTAGQLYLGRVIDDAVESLDAIRINGVGKQQRRSRGVIFRSFINVLQRGGFDESKAREIWRDQVLAIESLLLNAEEAA